MSVSRRKPVSQAPRRRPRVAGLSKPGAASRANTGETATDVPVADEPSVLSTSPNEATTESKEANGPGSKAGRPLKTQKVKPTPPLQPKDRDKGLVKSGAEKEPSAENKNEGVNQEKATVSSFLRSARGRQFTLAGALTVVAALLIWLALFFKVQLNESEASTGNTALIDVARTSQVKQDVDSAVETLFSYSYNDTAKTENAAKDLLINDQVRAKYAALFEQVKQHAPEQKLVVTVKVVRSALVTLDGDRARVLVFVDQTSLRTATGDQAVVGGGQLAVNAELHDGKWKIADLDGYNDIPQPTPSSGASPSSTEIPIPGTSPAVPTSAPPSSVSSGTPTR